MPNVEVRTGHQMLNRHFTTSPNHEIAKSESGGKLPEGGKTKAAHSDNFLREGKSARFF